MITTHLVLLKFFSGATGAAPYADVISAVNTYLLNKAAVTDIIGQRLYVDQLPQNVQLPAAVVRKTSGMQQHTLSDRVGTVAAVLTYECLSALRLTANTLAKTMYQCGITEVKGSTNSVDIRSVTVSSAQRNSVDFATDGSDEQRYVTSFDLTVFYRE